MIALKNDNAKTITDALSDILISFKSSPEFLRTIDGNELSNSNFDSSAKCHNLEL